MAKYFIVINNEQQGPFSIEEIAEQKIYKSTLVWNEKFEDWIEAGKVEELQTILKKSPPPIPNKQTEEKPVKIILTKEKSQKEKKDYSKTFESLIKLLPWSLLFGLAAFFISAFAIYDLNKFDNHDWSRVTYNGTVGYNYPLDKYSPDFYSNHCNPEKIIDCLKLNVAERKKDISEMSMKNGLVASGFGYIFIVVFYLANKSKSTEK